MSDMIAEPHHDTPRPALLVAMRLSALAAFAISAYLLYVALALKSLPAGCGEGSSCAAVLASRWSHLFGVPISAPAMLVYFTAFVASFFVGESRGAASSDNTNRRAVAWGVLMLASAFALAAAIAYVSIQAFVLRAFCPWCLAAHTAGSAMAIFASLAATRINIQPLPNGNIAAAAALVALGVTMAIQSDQSEIAGKPIVRAESGHAADDGTGRTLTLLDGKLIIRLDDAPMLGSPDAAHVIVALFDYACPKCRWAHHVMRDAMARPGAAERLAVVTLPMPRDRRCNPHIPETLQRFRTSCELASLAMAVRRAKPEAFATFDEWLYEPEMPRHPRDAHAFAVKLVGRPALAEALKDPWVNRQIQQGVAAYVDAGATHSPVIIGPGLGVIIGHDEELPARLERLISQPPETPEAPEAPESPEAPGNFGRPTRGVTLRNVVMDEKPQTAAATDAPDTALQPHDLELLRHAHETFSRLGQEVHKIIIGQEQIVRPMLASVLAQGHTLIVGVPGLAKTLLVKTLAQILGWSFKRIQFTPDMMPADIIGMELLQDDPATRQRSMRFVPGPIFANIILADEINRTPPKTQSALLEAMQEYTVTSVGRSYPLERPFVVFATQNPIEQEGTYPLPEAQLDRFMFSLWMDYPDANQERDIVLATTREGEAEVSPVSTREEMLSFQKLVRRVPVSQHVVDYAVAIARATRPNTSEATKHTKQFVEWGAGPRASQHMILAAKAFAVLDGRSAATAQDVREAAPLVLRHRVLPNYHATGEGLHAGILVDKLLKEVGEPAYAG